MTKSFFSGFILLAVLATGCRQENLQTEKIVDFKGLIDQQVDQLSLQNRLLFKTALMDQVESDSTFVPAKAGWIRELEIFSELDLINKPAYKNAYIVIDSLDDPSSNLLIRQLSSSEAPVPLIRLYYRDGLHHLKRIEATMMEINLLYSTQRKLTLEFNEEYNKTVLARYGIVGFEKMAGGDTIHFAILGEVN